ncbi:MAG: energy transducer TonB [Bdellovibrionales bacterium]|nr:energy transducer TonB [Bdellovibrionales bacterium]
MKQLRVSRNGLELASVGLRQSVSTLGRSPSCDGVLRAPGVRALHFLLEAQSESKDQWVIFDVSNDRGDGVVLGDQKVEFGGFFFELSDATLDSADRIGGSIRRSIQSTSAQVEQSTSRLVEAVRIRRDSGAVQEVAHMRASPGVLSRSRRLQPFEEVHDVVLESKREGVSLLLRSTKGTDRERKLYRNSEYQPLSSGGSVPLGPSDWIRLEYGVDDLYFRWVVPVPAARIPREVVGNPILRLGWVLFAIIALGVFGWIVWKGRQVKEVVPTPPPRIATIQVKEAPPPAPPVEKVPEPQVAPMEQGKASEEKASKGGSQAAAAKFAKAPSPKTKDQAGLNAPVKPTDVNSIGLLGALKSSAPKQGPGVKADQIFNDGIVTQAVSGNSGSLTLKTAPSGVLSVQGNSGGPKSKGEGLQALSTTLGGGDQYTPSAVGPIGRSGANGKGLGGGLAEGTGPGLEGIGGSDEGLGADIRGGLDAESVRKVIQSKRGLIRNCYERALLSKPKLSGRLVVNFQINGKGPVDWAKLKSSDANSPVLEMCLIDVVRQAMVFPQSPNGTATTVFYPFVFQPK